MTPRALRREDMLHSISINYNVKNMLLPNTNSNTIGLKKYSSYTSYRVQTQIIILYLFSWLLIAGKVILLKNKTLNKYGV
jgi:hypothetical protein